MLEDIDKHYLRSILNGHSKVGIECLFFETGMMPLRYEIMSRILMYLWKILHVKPNELIYRVFQSQSNFSHQGDWVRLVKKDKQNLGLDIDDEEIAQM